MFHILDGTFTDVFEKKEYGGKLLWKKPNQTLVDNPDIFFRYAFGHRLTIAVDRCRKEDPDYKIGVSFCRGTDRPDKLTGRTEAYKRLKEGPTKDFTQRPRYFEISKEFLKEEFEATKGTLLDVLFGLDEFISSAPAWMRFLLLEAITPADIQELFGFSSCPHIHCEDANFVNILLGKL